MSGISPIGKPIGKAFEYAFIRPIKALGNCKFMKPLGKAYRDNTNLVTGIAVGSLVIKDGIGGVMYVTQSLNNEKIPADKREFVAALDFTNTLVMISSQIGMALLISSPWAQKKIFNKVFGKYFNNAARETFTTAVRSRSKEHIRGKVLHDEIGKVESDVKSVLKTFTTVVASTVIGKRVLAPFIATPLADYAPPLLHKIYGKGKIKDDDCDQVELTQNANTNDKPAMAKTHKN